MSKIIEQILNEAQPSNIIGEKVNLQKKGKNFWGLCPFHEDSNPSMSVSDEKKIYKCFVCGHGGNVINFISDYDKISYGAAIKFLANKLGIEYNDEFTPKPTYNKNQEKLIAALNDAKDFFQYSLTSGENQAMKYLKSRKVKNKDIEKFAIGFAPEKGVKKYLESKGHDDSTLINASLITEKGSSFFKNRLIFPIINRFGDVIAFSGRALNDEKAKYINSVESQVFSKSQVFYNINNAYDSIKKTHEVFILEGFFDVIALDNIDIRNTVAIMGTALTKEHLHFLKNKKVTLMLDNDKAGMQAAFKSLKLLLNHSIKTSVIQNSLEKDADEILKSQGKEKLKEIIAKKIEGPQFVLNYLLAAKPSTPDEISKVIKKFGEYIRNLSSFEKEFYIAKLNKEFGISVEQISSLIPSYKKDLASYSTVNKSKIKGAVANRNYSYSLIKSMLKKQNLIKIFADKKVDFNNLMLSHIGKYIVAKYNKKDFRLSPSEKTLAKNIYNSSEEYVETKDEFEDLINIVNYQTNYLRKENMSVELNKTNSHQSQEKMLKALLKMQRKNRK